MFSGSVTEEPHRKHDDMDAKSLQRFQYRLEECYEFPCSYCFKFIVPQAGADEVRELLKGFDYQERASKGGKYLSFTAELPMESSSMVIGLYEAAAKIDGLIAL
jgi:hypothetical protein